jgi:hypothetical protein
VDVTVYSNGDEHYVPVAELKAQAQGKLEPVDPQRAAQIEQFVQEDSHINLPRLSCSQIRQVSQAFKAKNPDIILCHVLDRQFDGVDYFELIDQDLEDEFVIRAKLSRNSNQVTVDAQTNKAVAVKLKDVAFADAQTWVVQKLQLKKKVYQDAKCLIEWDTLVLNEQLYTVLRVTLTDRQGNPIFKHPLLLITNIALKTAEQARGVYGIYLMRAKIEALFKFLKDVLGWEEFQVRDYEAIKNIIALAYFVGGYFYEIGSDLTQNPSIELIAQLGGGKGQVTRYYVLQGLKKLLVHASVARFVKEHAISDDLFEHMLAFVT